MKWLNCVKTKVLLLGLMAVITLLVGNARADFVICDPKPVDEAINHESTNNVQGCSFLQNGLKLYFSASRDPSNTREIWVIERESQDAPWGEAVNLGPNVNGSGGTETEPSISPNDLELYFWRGGGWRSTRASTDEPWGAAAPYTGFYPDDFSPDGLTKYIWGTSSLGGYGGNDIWMATRATLDDPWSEPVNLGPNINDSGDQGAPSISNDGLALFFQTMQPWRIWMSFRATTEDEWGPAVQLGPEVNGYGWVAYPEISPDGSNLYFDSSSREGLSERFWQVSIRPIVDFNGDGNVDVLDLGTLIFNWGSKDTLCDIGPMPWGDGIVDVQDLKVLIKNWQPEILPPELVAYWRLDETEGTIAYDCADFHDGTWHGEPFGESGQEAIPFDGIDDYVSTPFVLNPACGEFSVFAWFMGGAPGQVIISQSGSADWLAVDPSDGCLMSELQRRRGASTLLSQTAITDLNWHSIGLVWDGSERILYVDDVEVARDTLSGLISSSGGLCIGAGKNLEPSSFFSGLIKDVRIYSRAIAP